MPVADASLANLKKFQPGNPGGPGAPRKRPLSASYDDWLRAKVDPATLVTMREKGIRVPVDATNADMVALAMGRQAISGNVMAAKEMGDRVEGKSTQRVELVSIEDRGIELHVIREERVLLREPQNDRVVDVEADKAVSELVEESSE